MNRYVLKINDSTYISDINWIAAVIPEIKTNSFDKSLIVTDAYLNEVVVNDGTNGGIGQTREYLIKKYYPKIEVVKVKVVIDE